MCRQFCAQLLSQLADRHLRANASDLFEPRQDVASLSSADRERVSRRLVRGRRVRGRRAPSPAMEIRASVSKEGSRVRAARRRRRRARTVLACVGERSAAVVAASLVALWWGGRLSPDRKRAFLLSRGRVAIMTHSAHAPIAPATRACEVPFVRRRLNGRERQRETERETRDVAAAPVEKSFFHRSLPASGPVVLTLLAERGARRGERSHASVVGMVRAQGSSTASRARGSRG